MLPYDELFSFDQKFELLGRVWLPGRPELETTAWFRSDGSAVDLRLFGDFAPGIAMERYPVIHATMPNKVALTLYDCAVGYEAAASTGVHLKLRPAAILEGWHAPEIDELTLSRFECTFEGLEEWMDLRPFKPVKEPPDDQPVRNLMGGVEFEVDELFNIDIDSLGLNLSTGGSMELRGGEWSNTECRLIHEASIRFRTDKPVTLRQCIEHAETFSQLLSLLSGTMCRPETITVDSWQSLIFGEGQPAETFRLSWQRLSRPNGARRALGITHRQIGGDFPRVLQQWYSDAKLLESPRRTFFATMESPPSFTAPLFLLLIQALEGHCLAIEWRTFLDETEWAELERRLVAVIKETVAGDARKPLIDKCHFLNRRSLRHHVERRWKALTPAVQNLIAQDIDAFPEKIINTRNFLTHLLEGENPLGPYLVMSIEGISNFLIALMLLRSGLSEAHVQALLERRPRLLNEQLVWHLY